MRNYYDQGNYQNRYRSNSGDRRMSFRCRVQYGQNYRGRLHYVNNYRNDFRRENFRGMQNYRSQILEVDIEVSIETKTLEEIEVGLGKDNIQVILEGMIKSVVVDQGQVSEPVLIKIGLDALHVGSIIISLKTSELRYRKRVRTNTANV